MIGYHGGTPSGRMFHTWLVFLLLRAGKDSAFRGTGPAESAIRTSITPLCKEKSKELHRSIQGFLEPHHKHLLAMLLNTVE